MPPEFIGVESVAMGRSVPVAVQRPLLLPVRVPKNRPPLMGGEGREVLSGPVPDCCMEDKEMMEEDALILLITTPEEMERREREATRCFCGDEAKRIDMVYGFLPDFVCLDKPNWRLPDIGEMFQLPVV